MALRPHRNGNIASYPSSRYCSAGAVNMNSFVVVFVPCDETGRDIEAAFPKQIDSTKFVKEPCAVRSREIEDTEQLPLWKWFISSK